MLAALLSLGVSLTLAGDVFLKRSNGAQSVPNLLLGLLFYSLGCIPVIFIFRMVQFGQVFIAWEALTVVLAVLIGRAFFGEAITTSRLIAVMLVVGALVLMGK